ncbi:MAG: serine hydrolase, partial [Acidobacteriota bacterium]|nr:serine hydrolase [Acidobacteriota bacterium]
MRITRAIRAIVVFAAVAFAAGPLWSQSVEERLEGFDEWVESVMTEWKVPGLGVAIVEDGKTVYARGYGWRDIERELPVTPDTLFAIGSNTKSFTATLLAMQVDDGALAWDEPVRTVLPEFHLHDPVATAQMTAADLLSHRSGLPRHDLYWLATGKSRAEMLAGLHHLEPSATFRSSFQYQNLMYMTAGKVSERIGGKSWEELVEERILRPLGMKRANFSVTRMQEDDDFSYGYGADEEIER